jgi:hypothetical protein
MRHTLDSVSYDIPDEWWTDAGMNAFVLTRPAYRPGPSPYRDLPGVVPVPIREIEPLARALSHGVFNDDLSNPARTARVRVTDILRAFRNDVALPPIEVERRATLDPYLYHLRHGVHRFYCAHAAGFSHVPVVVVDPLD